MLRYAITDRQMFPGGQRERLAALVAQAGRLASAGADLIQIRELDLCEEEMERLTRRVTDAVHAIQGGSGRPRILLNGPASLAIAAGADGVHLRGGAGAEDLLRVRLAFAVAARPAPMVSISCHTVDEVCAAMSAGFDYLLFGPVFEKRVHGEIVATGVGLDRLGAACRLVPEAPASDILTGEVRTRNILALGGVTDDNAALCVQAGASGVAGIRMFLEPRMAL